MRSPCRTACGRWLPWRVGSSPFFSKPLRVRGKASPLPPSNSLPTPRTPSNSYPLLFQTSTFEDHLSSTPHSRLRASTKRCKRAASGRFRRLLPGTTLRALHTAGGSHGHVVQEGSQQVAREDFCQGPLFEHSAQPAEATAARCRKAASRSTTPGRCSRRLAARSRTRRRAAPATQRAAIRAGTAPRADSEVMA